MIIKLNTIVMEFSVTNNITLKLDHKSIVPVFFFNEHYY